MNNNKIDYLEFASLNIDASKTFFSKVFDWQFEDYGPDYAAFSNQGVDGGFYSSDTVATTQDGAPLTVFYSDDIDSVLAAVKAADGKVVKAIFDFPGGRRFQFIEPGGNELAVWTDK